MQQIILRPDGTGEPLRVLVAGTFFRRFLGLMGRKHLPLGTGLLLAPCSSIHMMFMRFPIDAVYLDRDWRIQKVVKNLPPWRGISFCPKAWGCLELAAGEAGRLGLAPGATLHPEKTMLPV